MLVTARGGSTTIDRPMRDVGHVGRYWLLKTDRNDASVRYRVALEFNELHMAQEALRNKPEYAAVFDVISQRMWRPEGKEPRIVEVT